MRQTQLVLQQQQMLQEAMMGGDGNSSQELYDPSELNETAREPPSR